MVHGRSQREGAPAGRPGQKRILCRGVRGGGCGVMEGRSVLGPSCHAATKARRREITLLLGDSTQHWQVGRAPGCSLGAWDVYVWRFNALDLALAKTQGSQRAIRQARMDRILTHTTAPPVQKLQLGRSWSWSGTPAANSQQTSHKQGVTSAQGHRCGQTQARSEPGRMAAAGSGTLCAPEPGVRGVDRISLRRCLLVLGMPFAYDRVCHGFKAH